MMLYHIDQKEIPNFLIFDFRFSEFNFQQLKVNNQQLTINRLNNTFFKSISLIS